MFDLRSVSGKNVLVAVLLFLLGLSLGYLGYRWIPNLVSQEEEMIIILQEEQSKIAGLIEKRPTTRKQVSKELSLIRKKQKEANQKKFMPVRGLFANERNELMRILQESYCMILNLEQTMMIGLLDSLESMELLQKKVGGLIHMVTLIIGGLGFAGMLYILRAAFWK